MEAEILNNYATTVIKEDIMGAELKKQNITEEVINSLQKYKDLKISGIDDKRGYAEVDNARKHCKSIRNLAEKICKKGREEALNIQRAWVSKEKEVTGKIIEVENHLLRQLHAIDDEKKRIEREAEDKRKEKLQEKIDLLNECGYPYDPYVISFMSEADFEAVKEKAMAHKAENEKIKREEEERREKEKREMEVEKKKLADMLAEQEKIKAELKAEQEKIEARKREIEEAEKKKKEEDERIERYKMLSIQKAKQDEERRKLEEERAKLAEELARQQTMKEAEEREKQRLEEERKAEEEAKAREAMRPDKDKLASFADFIAKIEIPAMTTEQGKQIAIDVQSALVIVSKKLLDKIKNM